MPRNFALMFSLELDHVRALLARLDGESADALESETVEFKSWNRAPPAKDSELRSLRETVVCLANRRGGVIVLGVADRKRSRSEAIQGVGDLEEGEIRRAIYDGTDPHILVEVQELIEPEARLLAVRVPRGLPPHTTTEGVGKIRVDKDCKPLTGSQLAQLMVAEARRDLTAESVPGLRISDLDGDEIERFRRRLRSEGRKTDLATLPAEELLQNLGLVNRGEVTLAAILIMGRQAVLNRLAPQHEVIFTRFRGQTEYDVRQDLKGPMLGVMDRLESLLSAHLQVTQIETGGFVQLDIPDLTWWVAREAILNALVHRDYFLTESVQIELRPGRVQVTSPGGFVGGVSPGNILRHPPVRRNPLLAETFQALGLVERAGLGVDRIYRELLRLGKGIPRYEADEAHVRLTLPTRTNRQFARFVSEEEQARRRLELDDLILLHGTVERGALDRWSGAELLQLSEEEAASRLSRLRERGYLVSHGRGRATSYRLARRHSDLLRGRAATDRDFALEEEAVRLRVQQVLAERGRLTNSEIRQISGFDRRQVVSLMKELRKEGLVKLRGAGRGAHYVPGPAMAQSAKRGRPGK